MHTLNIVYTYCIDICKCIVYILNFIYMCIYYCAFTVYIVYRPNVTILCVQYINSHAYTWLLNKQQCTLLSPQCISCIILITGNQFMVFCLFPPQSWNRGSSWDPSVPEVHWVADPQASVPASGSWDRSGFQDRLAFPERCHRCLAGVSSSSGLCIDLPHTFVLFGHS